MNLNEIIPNPPLKIQKGGIYGILCKSVNKIYIGCTSNFKRRFTEHKWMLEKHKHHNDHLQNIWNRDGYSSIDFLVLEYCAPEIQLEREEYYYQKVKAAALNFYPPVETRNFNKKSTGGRVYKHNHSDETIRKVKLLVIQGRRIRSIGRELNIPHTTVSGIKRLKICKSIASELNELMLAAKPTEDCASNRPVMTPEIKEEIIKMLDKGDSLALIAKHFKTTDTTVLSIKNKIKNKVN